MTDENKPVVNTANEKKEFAQGCGCLIILLVLFLLMIRGCTSENNVPEPAPAPSVSKNDVSKSTFKGEWPLTVDTAKVYCVDLGGLTGAKVKVDDKEYAITQNLTDLAFLPGSLWADQPLNEVGGCLGASIDGKCKVSLYDLSRYADTICE